MKTFLLTVVLFISILQISFAQYERQHVALGIGPSMIYADNAGLYSTLDFKILPVFTLSYNHQLSDFFDIRGTLGSQLLNSGGFDPIESGRVAQWGLTDQAFDFKGVGYFLDVMPVYNINPNTRGRAGEVVNFYAGLGIGVINVQREQEVLKDVTRINGVFVNGTIVESKQSDTSIYIPLRLGMSTNLEYDWDFAFEASALTTTSTNLDGNNIQYKSIKPELLLQFQVVLIRYLAR